MPRTRNLLPLAPACTRVTSDIGIFCTKFPQSNEAWQNVTDSLRNFAYTGLNRLTCNTKRGRIMLYELFFTHTAAQAILILSLCIITGLLLGHVKIGTISLGVGGVLFSSIAVGHFGLIIDKHVLHFAREFGLILFVYSIGMQVGPGFVESLKRNGLRLNLMAAFIVCTGTIIAGACFIIFDVPLPVIVGLYSGAVTNTPSLAASTQMFGDLLNNAESTASYISQAGLGYAAAYPFGILGIILIMILVRFIFRINIAKENEDMEKQSNASKQQPNYLTVEITNEAIVGKRLDSIRAIQELHVVFSRVEQMRGVMHTPKPGTILTHGTLLHAVGEASELEKLVEIMGKKSEINLHNIEGSLEIADITVTRNSLAGKTIKKLDLGADVGIIPTRVIRSGFEFTATPSTVIHFGDTLRIVSDSEGIFAARRFLGDSPKSLEHPQIIPIFAAIFIGILLGSIPIFIPGLSGGLKLGLAGGPLLIAILFSRVHKIGGMVCYISPSASLMIREMGISLFLATVGLNAGPGFVPMILNGDGLYWMGIGSLITFLPLVITALFAWIVLKCNYPTICGLLAGSMTDPPALAFSTQILGSDSSASVYATVYPLTMILRIFTAQLLVLFLFQYAG